jgi:serpin B
MKKMTMWVAVALMTVSAVVGCTSDDVTMQEPNPTGNDTILSNEDNEYKYIELTRGEQQLVNHSNDFAFKLFRELVAEDKSLIVSPISITYALGMLNNGAAGETQAQINKVLGFGDTGADGINSFCSKMLTEAPNLDKLTKVMIANTIFMNKDYVLKQEFISKAKQFYDAEPETRDFNDGQTLDVINKWGSDHTMGMIPEVLNKGSFNPYAVSYLLNAIYFKGAWAEKFDKADTKDEEFQTGTGKKQVPMMHQEHEFNYAEDELCQALRLPYGNRAYNITLLLPKEGKTVNDVLQTLTKDTWQRYRWMCNSAIVDVKLPRFESNSDIGLKDIMTKLGMPNAFDDQLAEFPNFCNVPTYIGLMKQVAKIKLNEEGTEAAAITVIGMDNEAMAEPQEPQHVNFHANRPFLYVISEQSTGAIFFIGKYVGD